MVTIETLLEYLALYGGEIISTKDLQPEWIEQARVSGRLYVDNNSLGFVWEPEFKDGLPTTEKEVEWFEKWYPLKIELPEHLKDPSFLFKKRISGSKVIDESRIKDFIKRWERIIYPYNEENDQHRAVKTVLVELETVCRAYCH